MSDYIKDLIKATNNKLAAVASDGLYTDDISYIDTGSYMLNAMLSGDMYKGIPGRITMFAGPTSTGKTYLLLSIVKHFIEQDPEHNVVFYFESEGAVNTNMLESRGINTKRLVLLPVSTLEEFRTQMLNVMKQYEERSKLSKYKILFCLDSLGMLSSTKEMEDTADGKATRDMTKASLVKGIFRVLTLKLSELNMCLLVSNHVYDSIGCLKYDTPVLMSDGSHKPIIEVSIGDFVKTLSGDNIVTNKFKYTIDQYIQLELSDGTIISCTPNHKFLTNKLEWKTAEDLNEEDIIMANCS